MLFTSPSIGASSSRFGKERAPIKTGTTYQKATLIVEFGSAARWTNKVCIPVNEQPVRAGHDIIRSVKVESCGNELSRNVVSEEEKGMLRLCMLCR
jgi:hypothetical protein